mgnify:CR=1 FL=1
MTEFVQALVAGLALGAIYGLIALGLVVIYKATGVLSFAQGGFVYLGAFVVWQFSNDWGWNFYLSIALAMVVLAVIAAVIERVVLRRMVGEEAFTVILVTIGILLVINQLVPTIWSDPGYVLDSPWIDQTVELGDIRISHADLWTVGVTALLFALFFVFFRYTRTGLGMRAAAVDQEAAAAQGVSVARSFQISWAIAGAVAVVAGVMLTATSGDTPTLALSFSALRAFPAMILGGLDSPGGAVVGGLIIGVAEVMTATYLDYEWLGTNFDAVMPYLILIAVLLWRPTGLFGTQSVERV